jgi:hypothetical protein
LSLSFSEL